MTLEETKTILIRQRECFIRRTEGCDGKCLACDLLATKEDVLGAYDKALSAVDYTEEIGGLPTCNTCAISKECKVKPEWGYYTRINCFMHVSEE